MPVKGLTLEEIAAANAAVVAAGGKSTDRANRLPGETASEANARITAAYRNQPKPELSEKGKTAGATIQFVRGGAGGVGTYKEVFPIGGGITPTSTATTTAVTPQVGTGIYQMLNGILYFDGKPFTGTWNGQNWENGKSSDITTSSTTQDFVSPMSTISSGQAERQSAYDLLYQQFNQYGLGALVEPLKGLITSGASPSEFTIRLRETPAYQKRFAANAKRIANGFAAIDEATYLALEDKYQSIMQNYGLPPSYYAKGEMGIQAGFEDLIAGNVDAVTLEERVIEGQKVLKGSKQILDAAKQFYPSLTDGDFLGYVLNPKNALSDIKRKVSAAEIGGAQLGAGLAATAAGAEALVASGVTGQRYQQAAPMIEQAATRGGQLAAMYNQTPYTQQTAEQAILNIPGSTEALKQTDKLTALEKASFAKKSGVGILSRERAGTL